MNKRQKRGWLLVAIGVVLILAAVGLHMVQQRQDMLAGQNARILLEQLALSKGSVPPEGETAPEETTDMPVKEYMGYAMIGTLRIPSVEIELPILNTWDYDLLNVTACRYSGSIATGDMILLGHNYGSHFGPLRQVEVGAEVEFEDVNGIQYRYVVVEVEQLHKSEGERLSADYALSLFTCTPGGQNRIVVRCIEIE